MKGDEYVAQLKELGQTVHWNDGVAWERTGPFFWRTALPMQTIDAGLARPSRLRAFGGYRHLLPDGAHSSWVRRIMWLDGESVQGFSMASLGSSKRARVRKGLRLLEIRAIQDVEAHLEEMRQVCMSAVLRNGAGRPARYYVDRESEWKLSIRRLFRLPNRTWLGAFLDGRLIAYYHAYEVDGVAFISAAKSHTEGLHACPNDALLYCYLEDRARGGSCVGVVFGDATQEGSSLDRFKGTYGFRVRALPEFRWLSPVGRALESRFRRRAARERGQGRPAGTENATEERDGENERSTT